MTQTANEIINSNDQCIAALDIGSNSFHFVLARIIDDHLQILHSEKHSIKLAQGLDEQGYLSQQAIDRSLKALTVLANTTKELNNDNFRIVATYTLRKAKNAYQFLEQAAKIFPFDIEVISGHEEARLIYQGVSRYVALNDKCLVLDIGGGSTECIIGKNEQIFTLDSLEMGCVSFARSYFSDGNITKKAFEHAILHASLEIEAVSARFNSIGWKSVIGTSGTIKTIYQLINIDQELPQPITLEQLHALRDRFITYGHVDDLNMEGLKEHRKNIICPGLAILIALAEVFAIKEIDFCAYALREGVLFEQLNQKLLGNVYSRTVNSLITRFNVDTDQIERVQNLSLQFFDQVKDGWSLNGKHYQNLLKWAGSLHEIGLSINASGFHKHGRYILENADLAGFNQEQVQAISWLVGHHRRKIQVPDNYSWFLLKPNRLSRLLVILRLACLFNKQRQLSQLPSMSLSAKQDDVNLSFTENYLASAPLLHADLIQEQAQLKALNINLNVT